MKKVLLISGHPDLKASKANSTIIREFEKLCPDVSVRQLDIMYPDYRIDVKAEQEALVRTDIIILQFPFYWYYMPALLKKWLDDVFTHGFAHGSKGKALEGKKLILSFTSGASEDEYQHGAAMNYEIEEFMTPFKQTANLCGLELLKRVYSGGMMYVEGISDENALKNIEARAKEHAKELYDVVSSVK